MARLSLLTWIGHAAAALCGRRGAVTQQAQTAPCCRQTVYDHADKVQQALADAQLPGPDRPQLLEENRQLRLENQQLWDWPADTIECPKDKQQHFAVTAAALGLSLQQMLTLLAVWLPLSRLPSRASLGRWVHQAAHRAGRLLAVLDRAARTLVVGLCLDEIFLHRKPVLMGIEPSSMAWVLGQRTTDCSGATWAKALRPWPQVRQVAADGGSGLTAGLQAEVHSREQAAHSQTEPVPLAVQLDVFHSTREGGRVRRADGQQAEAVWEEAEKVERAKRRFDRRGTDRRHFRKRVVNQAWSKAVAAFAEADGKEKAWQRARAAVRVLRPDGRLNDRAWATAELKAATAVLRGQRWAKTRRMLLDSRTLTFLDRLHEGLAVAEPDAERREALVALGRWRQEEKRPEASGASGGVWREVVTRRVRVLLGQEWQADYARVAGVLRGVLRASSAVECVNSVVRMHQSRHRNLSQELLNLKRLYWNSRRFVSGKRKGRCPYEHLGLKLPTYDPWGLLQAEPEQWKQLLSSSEVRE